MKSNETIEKRQRDGVAPLAGARIEMQIADEMGYVSAVAPLAGARIEIMGAWLEANPAKRRPSRRGEN